MGALLRWACWRGSDRMRSRHQWAWCLASILLVIAVDVRAGGADAVRLNEIQVIGTHNSYHAGLAPGVQQLLRAEKPEALLGLAYRHPPLDEQLSAGIRQLEIDIYADTRGGRFAHPRSLDWVRSAGLPADEPWDSPAIRAKPGFKVLHTQDIDYRSNCQPFTACLGIVRLTRAFSAERVEAACMRALEIGARTYGSVRSILDNRLDRRPAPKRAADSPAIAHTNIRGPRYYH